MGKALRSILLFAGGLAAGFFIGAAIVPQEDRKKKKEEEKDPGWLDIEDLDDFDCDRCMEEEERAKRKASEEKPR